jgi:hypothetical protein
MPDLDPALMQRASQAAYAEVRPARLPRGSYVSVMRTASGVTHYYFRMPEKMRLPDGVAKTLPSDLQGALKRAQELVALCVPVGRPPLRRMYEARYPAIGERFNHWTVIGAAPKQGRYRMVRCMCICGNERVIGCAAVRRGATKSCGCIKYGKRRLPGGHKRDPLYCIWASMRDRCRRVRGKAADRYALRGIRVCDRWESGDGFKSGFECFLDDMGRRPSRKHSIDRINNDGNYEPGNCRWATIQEQARNKSGLRLCPKSAAYIKAAARDGHTAKEVATDLGLSLQLVSAVFINRTWKDIAAAKQYDKNACVALLSKGDIRV